jgi:hypothetical protein
MELNEWIKKYEKKAERFSIPDGFLLHYEPDKGFFLYKKLDKAFIIDACSTNNIHWAQQKANDMAKERGCTFLSTQTHRDPAAYMRLTKAEINLSLSGVRKNGLMYWVFEKAVK